MALYEIVFSPTGGTKKAADILTKGWNEASTCSCAEEEKAILIDLAAVPEVWKKEQPRTAFTAQDTCIIAVPSFKGRVPGTAISRLKELCGNGARAIELVVYGNRLQEDTLIELQDTIKEAGFLPVAAVTAIAEHSMVRTVAAGRPDADDVKMLRAFAEEIAAKLEIEEESVRNSEPEIPGNRPYKPYPQEPCSICVNDACISCGKCAAVCPAGAIPAESPNQTDGELCIGCMRCVSICPTSARGMTEQKRIFITDLLGKLAAERKDNELYL